MTRLTKKVERNALIRERKKASFNVVLSRPVIAFIGSKLILRENSSKSWTDPNTTRTRREGSIFHWMCNRLFSRKKRQSWTKSNLQTLRPFVRQPNYRHVSQQQRPRSSGWKYLAHIGNRLIENPLNWKKTGVKTPFSYLFPLERNMAKVLFLNQGKRKTNGSWCFWVFKTERRPSISFPKNDQSVWKKFQVHWQWQLRIWSQTACVDQLFSLQ